SNGGYFDISEALRGHPDFQPEQMDYAAFQSRFPEEMTFTPLFQEQEGTHNPNIYFTQDNATPPRRWLLIDSQYATIGNENMIEALRQGSIDFDFFRKSDFRNTESYSRSSSQQMCRGEAFSVASPNRRLGSIAV